MNKIISAFIDKFRLKRSAAGARVPAATPSGSSLMFLNPQGTAMNVATVYGCVDVLAGAVSNLALLYEKKKNGIFTADDNPLNYLFNVEPCEYMTAADFWRLLVQDMLLEGNAYVVPMRMKETGDVWRLTRVNPHAVMHDTVSDVYKINDIEASVSGEYAENEIIHLKNYTKDGKTGLSTLSFARITADTALCGDEETLNRFRNGGNVRGIVSDDGSGVKGFGDLQDTELEKAAESLDDKFSNGQKIVSMPGATKFSPITLSSADMQFLESRKFNGLDICRFFRVPPQFVFYDTASNYKSAEMANVAFLSNTLNPLLRKIEGEFMRKLVPMRHTGKYRIRFDREDLLAADLDSRARYMQAMVGIGLYTVNELRAKENKPAIEGGDKVLVSANLKDINELGAPSAEESKADAEAAE